MPVEIVLIGIFSLDAVRLRVIDNRGVSSIWCEYC